MAEIYKEPERGPSALVEMVQPVLNAIAATVLVAIAGIVGLTLVVAIVKGCLWFTRL